MTRIFAPINIVLMFRVLPTPKTAFFSLTQHDFIKKSKYKFPRHGRKTSARVFKTLHYIKYNTQICTGYDFEWIKFFFRRWYMIIAYCL